MFIVRNVIEADENEVLDELDEFRPFWLSFCIHRTGELPPQQILWVGKGSKQNLRLGCPIGLADQLKARS